MQAADCSSISIESHSEAKLQALPWMLSLDWGKSCEMTMAPSKGLLTTHAECRSQPASRNKACARVHWRAFMIDPSKPMCLPKKRNFMPAWEACISPTSVWQALSSCLYTDIHEKLLASLIAKWRGHAAADVKFHHLEAISSFLSRSLQ